MTFTNEQFNALSKYEGYFETATKEHWTRYPGGNALDQMVSIYKTATKVDYRLHKSCANCVYLFIKDCGTLYFKDKEERDLKPKRTRKK